MCSLYLLVVIFAGAKGGSIFFSDQPCNARATANNSVVCVCTASYCDTVIRETPSRNTYYTYTSSKSGKRFEKSSAELQDSHLSFEDNAESQITIKLNQFKTYQTIFGIGGAISDSAAINWRNLTNTNLMENLIESYCGSTGIEYSMLRVPMGSSDFSTHRYTYSDQPENDVKVDKFSLASEDYEYKIPMIKACMAASKVSIKVLGSLWFPPLWMKDNTTKRIKREYFQNFADYYYKFLNDYDEAGVPVWGITLTNEATNSVLDINYGDTLGWTIPGLGEWVEYYLGPTIRGSKYKDLKILTCDDQRFTIQIWYNLLVDINPGVYKYLDGVAVHFYYDKTVSASTMTDAMKQYPEKFLLYTEACNGLATGVDLGSWTYAENYIISLLEVFNNNVTGWIDWNMVLNMQGGPNWLNNYVDAAILVDAERGEFLKQPMYYAIGQFSKFIPPGSQRIESIAETSEIDNVAFLTPQNTIVVVLYNSGPDVVSVRILLEDRVAIVELDPATVMTIEFPCIKC